jgi:hypothetical protein
MLPALPARCRRSTAVPRIAFAIGAVAHRGVERSEIGAPTVIAKAQLAVEDGRAARKFREGLGQRWQPICPFCTLL